jgi:hypothetical protein
MSARISVVHSEPEILGGPPYSLAHACRYENSSTILSVDTVSPSLLTHFRPFLGASKSST